MEHNMKSYQSVETVPEWVHLIPAGLFAGRDGRGPFLMADVGEVIRETKKYWRGVDIIVDYEHQTENAEGNGQPDPAAGWIKELKSRPDGLWGRVEWTPRARQMIEVKEYRYISPVFTHNKEGQIHRLDSVALVGQPNLELKALNKRQAQGVVKMDLLAQLAALLGLEEGATEEAVFSAVKALVETKADSAEAGQNKTDPQSAADPADLPQAEAELLAAVETLIDTADSAAEAGAGNKSAANKAEPQGQASLKALHELGLEVVKMQKELAHQKASGVVSAAMKAGKITPAMKVWATNYAANSPKEFAEYIKTAPTIVGVQSSVRPVQKSANSLSLEEQEVCRQLGIEEDSFMKTRSSLSKRTNS
jgi:phage I-like protein